MRKVLSVAACILMIAGYVSAEEAFIKITLVNEQGVGKEIGTITASDSKYGLILTPQLIDLTPGLHGFHVHDKPDCSHARKESRADSGDQAGPLSAQYVPVENSFEAIAAIARALLRQPSASLRPCWLASCRFARCAKPPCNPDRIRPG